MNAFCQDNGQHLCPYDVLCPSLESGGLFGDPVSDPNCFAPSQLQLITVGTDSIAANVPSDWLCSDAAIAVWKNDGTWNSWPVCSAQCVDTGNYGDTTAVRTFACCQASSGEVNTWSTTLVCQCKLDVVFATIVSHHHGLTSCCPLPLFHVPFCSP